MILKNNSKVHSSEESGTNKPVKYNFPDSSMQMLRLQRETDFLKYLKLSDIFTYLVVKMNSLWYFVSEKFNLHGEEV